MAGRFAVITVSSSRRIPLFLAQVNSSSKSLVAMPFFLEFFSNADHEVSGVLDFGEFRGLCGNEADDLVLNFGA